MDCLPSGHLDNRVSWQHLCVVDKKQACLDDRWVVSVMALWCPEFSLSGCIQAMPDGYIDGTWLFWK